jgi:hypothetical protein
LVSIRDSIPFDGTLRLRLTIAQQDAERFEEADKDTKKALKDDTQWKTYLCEIKKIAVANNDKKIDVGKFSSTRSFQLHIRNDTSTDPPKGNISPKTRAKSKKDGFPTATVENSSTVKAMADAETQSSDPIDDPDSAHEAQRNYLYHGCGLSNFSAAHPDSAKHLFARRNTRSREHGSLKFPRRVELLRQESKKAALGSG